MGATNARDAPYQSLIKVWLQVIIGLASFWTAESRLCASLAPEYSAWPLALRFPTVT